MTGAPARIRQGSAMSECDWRALDALGMKRLATDSRLVRRGDTFLAYPGETQDGRRYIPQAIEAGATAIVWERRGFRWCPEWAVPNVPVRNLRRHAGEIAGRVYGNTGQQLWTVGITGTNGKTSCSQWIAQSLSRTGRRCGVIGTLGSGLPGRLKPAVNTTPDAVSLHSTMSGFRRAGASAVSMEVSSIGLAQDRVSGVRFDVAMLTNLTRDHLEYHRTMSSYRREKAKLFALAGLRYRVLNLDDRFGAELAAMPVPRRVRTVGYGFDVMVRRRGVRLVTGAELVTDARGISFDVESPWGSGTLRSALIGRFNASNLLGSLAVLLASDVAFDEAVAALASVKPIPGRLERFGGGRWPLVVVDYAHTPDALENVLTTLRDLLSDEARLTCVFGCGGDRDPGKRPMMGRVAKKYAHRVIVTTDNPRSEDPRHIVAQIVSGVGAGALVVLDRARAIRHAIRHAKAGDIVLVAGKGHETYQETKGRRLPFDDRQHVSAVLREMRA